jgi:regulatory protein
VQQYLYRKTRPKRIKTGELKEGVSVALTERVFSRLDERGYLNDESFARYWAENRQLRKGISQRKLQAELRAKGVNPTIIEEAIGSNERDDSDELKKVIEKKARRYDDPQKLIAYLARQGFSYDDIKSALAEDND